MAKDENTYLLQSFETGILSITVDYYRQQSTRDVTQVTHKYNYKQQIRLTVFPLGSSLLPLWAKSLLFVTAEFRA